MKTNQNSFTEDEVALIREFDSETPFRVLQTTSEEDLKILRKSSEEAPLKSLDLAYLISRMYQTVTDERSNGVGIAAPQIGVNRQVILVKRIDKDHEFEYFVNPKIIWKSEVQRLGEEGCLSIPNAYQNVLRSLIITIEFQNLEGDIFTETIQGFVAVIFQHEVDHLNGVLFTDYLGPQSNYNYHKASDLYYIS